MFSANVTSTDLFPGPRIRSWLPNETLFSLASRQHVLSGNWSPSETCHQLFGHARNGCAHDFPSNLDALVERTSGQLGNAEEIVYGHTMLPFYFTFRKDIDKRNAMACARSGGIAGLKARLGIPASRFGASHPLKACRACMAVDAVRHGTSYWHLDHQYPGVWICHLHDQFLQAGSVKVTGLGRFLWYLPAEAELHALWATDECPPEMAEEARSFVKAFGECAIESARLAATFHFDRDRLSRLYLTGCMDAGLVSDSGRQRHDLIADAILPLCLTLREIPELGSLPNDADQVFLQFSRILSKDRAPSHPFRHFVMILALFGSWGVFWKRYVGWHGKAVPTDLQLEPPVLKPEPAPDNRAQRFLDLIQDQKVSISGASAAVGIDTQTGLVWAKKAGLPIRRRPKILTGEVRDRLIAALRIGKDKQIVAADFGVSVQTVTHVLQTEIGLSEKWHGARFSKSQRLNRSRWTNHFSKYPEDAQQDFRKSSPASFMWLYRNDRDWLAQQVASLPLRPGTNYSSVPWDARDRELASQVLQAGLAIKLAQGTRRITLGQVCQKVSGLKSKLSKLKSLPLTRNAISSVTRFAALAESSDLL
jgi:hypothetical protein